MSNATIYISAYERDTLINEIKVVEGQERKISIGRQDTPDTPKDFIFADPAISRDHATIRIKHTGEVEFEDHSSNGTLIDGSTIQQQARVIRRKTELKFGSKEQYRIIIKVPEAEGATSFIPEASEGVRQEDKNVYLDLDKHLSGTSEYKIGRGDQNDLVLQALTISRSHAALKLSGSQWSLTDVGSKNGTFLNGNQVLKATAVNPGDIIQIGPYQIFLSGAGKQAAQPSQSGVALLAQKISRVVDGGKKTILHETSLKIREKSLVAIMGPAGCGKSTLMNALNGFSPASSGNVFVRDTNLYKNYDYLKKRFGYVPQDDIVHKELTVYDTLRFAAKLRLESDVSSAEIDQKIDDLLRELKIEGTKHTKVANCSGGQRKRVCIALELLTEPDILFMDEPTSPLDPETIEEFLNILKRLASRGTAIIMVTHKPSDLRFMDEVIFLANGGYMAYHGHVADFKTYFGVDDVIKVYEQLSNPETGAQWMEVQRSDNPTSAYQASSNPANVKHSSKDANPFTQTFWLAARYLRIKTNDVKNTVGLIAQAPIIAGILILIFDSLAPRTLYMMAICAIWFGTNNAAREIVSEIPVYLRERMYNLRILPYIFSKLFILSGLNVIQSAIFVAILVFALDLELPLQTFAYMFYLSFSATLMGLFISSMLDKSEKVMTILPLILIPQIMLAGVMSPIDDDNVPMNVLSHITLGRWGTQGFGNIQDTLTEKGKLMIQPVDAQGNPAGEPYAEEKDKTGLFHDFIPYPDFIIDEPHEIEYDYAALSVLNLLFFIGTFWGMKRKDVL